MSKTNILNLDDLTVEEKVIIIDGTSHTAAELTVEGYVARVKKAKEMQAKAAIDSVDGEIDATQSIENFVSFITDMFPTIKPVVLRKLSLRKLNKIIEFAMAAPTDIAEKVEGAAEKVDAAGNV